ncbi:MAG: proprotein convertase P-domain-containing protein [Lewinellaceae bacterium]|nr:proprotein convertase P-domain-containing protein [Lewinellaceae bacterium]
MPVSLQASPFPSGNPPAIWQGVQDSTEALLGHCQPIIAVEYNCSEGTIELSAYVSWLFTGVLEPIEANWSTGETAYKIIVSPPGTWTWDASGTGCEPYHYDDLEYTDNYPSFPPATPQLVSPVNGSTGMPASVKLVWTSIYNAIEYRVEVARNPTFSPASIYSTMTVADTSTTISPLPTNNTVYYWRVKALNGCGESAFSAVYSFQTGQPLCNQVFTSTDVPAAFQIHPDSSIVALSELDVLMYREILDVNVAVVFDHPWTGDLSARLVAPTQDTILLFDRPGVPASTDGCPRGNGNLNFDQQTSQAASLLEAQCRNTPPALNGSFQALGDLTALNGKNSQGQWQMILTDHNAGLDTGAIQSWNLTFCFASAVPPATLLANFPLYVVTGEADTISSQHLKLELSGAPSTGIFSLMELPQHGTIFLNGVPMTLGTQFTQIDIDLGHLVYEHNGDTAMADEFRFDALDNVSKAWLHSQVFQIIILSEPFAATAVISQAIVCQGAMNGEITVNATGLGGIYTYSLNGGAAQNSSVFGNLSAGTYVITVISQSGISISTLPVTIVDPPAMAIIPTIVCDHFTVDVTGATPPVQYSLDAGPFQTENQFSNLPNGSYALIVQDSNGCVVSDTIVVAIIPLSLSSEMVQPKCAGNQNGKITAIPQGGQMPFVFNLNGGQGQSSAVFNNLPAGVYNLFVSDNQGCTASVNVQLAEPDPIQLATIINWNNISVQASGGTGILMYSINGIQFQADSQFLNVPNGNYQLTVRDDNGCTAVMPVTINVLQGSIQGPTSVCAGNVISITVSASGGTPPYEYQLNGGAFQSGNVFSNLGAGVYNIVIRDSDNTEIPLGTHVCTENPNPAVSAMVHCRDAILSIFGGMPPYTSNPSAGQLMFLANGNYQVTVTDAKGCTASTSFEINAPVLTATTEIVDVLCYGDSTGSATIEGMGGIPPYMYSFFGGPFQSNNTFDSLPGGWYYYVVQDSGGCEDQLWLEIKQPDSAALNTTVIGNTILANATGGTGAYTYRLNNGPGQSSGLFEDLALGVYSVSAEDEVQCVLMEENLAVVTIGTKEPDAHWKTEVWPNPGNGLFRLLLQNAPTDIRAEVYSSSGQLLQHQEIKSVNGRVETTLHLEYYPQGTYLLLLTDGESREHVFLRKVSN